GFFSLCRELMTLYLRDQYQPKHAFWHFAWIAFIISSLFAWVIEHRLYIAEKAKNGQPHFSGELQEVYVWSSQLNHTNNTACTYITVKVSIANTRPVASTIRRLCLSVRAGERLYECAPSSVQELALERLQHGPKVNQTVPGRLLDFA